MFHKIIGVLPYSFFPTIQILTTPGVGQVTVRHCGDREWVICQASSPAKHASRNVGTRKKKSMTHVMCLTTPVGCMNSMAQGRKTSSNASILLPQMQYVKISPQHKKQS